MSTPESSIPWGVTSKSVMDYYHNWYQQRISWWCFSREQTAVDRVDLNDASVFPTYLIISEPS